jgi:ketosteroid isomerase-like protein
MQWFRDISDVMPMRYDDSGAIDCGPGRAIGVLNTHYRSATGGVGSVQRMWIVFTVKDGRVVRSEAYTDPNAALDAAKS